MQLTAEKTLSQSAFECGRLKTSNANLDNSEKFFNFSPTKTLLKLKNFLQYLNATKKIINDLILTKRNLY